MFQNLLALLLASTLTLGSPGVELASEEPVFDDSTLLSVSTVPYKQPSFIEPGFMSSKATIAIDLTSQTLLYEHNSTYKLPIASLTKLMTAYIILEENDPDAVVTISANAAGTIGSSMGLFEGEKITVKNLLFGLLIKSGNDAATALAEFNSGSEANFVKKMNYQADMLGLDQTQFANPTGLDYGESFSTPRDLALLSSYLLKEQTIREIVKLSSTDVTSIDGYSHHLVNTNILLGDLGIKGLKTGKTPSAGECFISLAESPDGNEILTVVLGSKNRFADTKVLIDWIYRAYIW